ncbi:Crotonyl-CoA reductase [Paraconexibacter sp. AEG42_29]|uniref:Crotonyl-CoA reductase n=1 Tax=Paraconexibacter sp. AEG42_29 TaxID=2997339 RepID=A0AAU7AYL4_9ACTN
MLTLSVTEPNPKDPVAAIDLREKDAPVAPEGWATVDVRTAALNHHDVWSLRGALDRSWLPLVLGSDGAGVDQDGNEVILYPLIADAGRGGGDETLDPQGMMLSSGIDGTFAGQVVVPRRNLIPKPAELSWEAAGSLGTAWLTAYRMLFSGAGLTPGSTVLVQGAGGGVATALIAIGRASGLRVWVASEDAGKRARAVDELGAHAAFSRETRLPERVDAVMETVGEATWGHSLRAVRPGGKVVVSGATTGPNPPADLTRVFLPQVSIVGATMGTRVELERLIRLCVTTGIAPTIDATFALGEAHAGVERMVSNRTFGKVVFDCTAA